MLTAIGLFLICQVYFFAAVAKGPMGIGWVLDGGMEYWYIFFLVQICNEQKLKFLFLNS